MGEQNVGVYTRKKLLHAWPYVFAWTHATGHCQRLDANIWADVYILTDQFEKLRLAMWVTEKRSGKEKEPQFSDLPAAGHSRIEQNSFSLHVQTML